MENAIPDLSAESGKRFSFTFPRHTFSDADGDDLSYTATRADGTPLPAWLTFQGRSFQGTPQATDKETVSVKLTASDGDGGSVGDAFNIEVGDPLDVLVQFGTAADSNPIRVRESGTSHRLLLLLSTAAPRELIIPLDVTHVGGASTDDYDQIPASVTIARGARNAGFNLHAVPDGAREPGEGLRLDIGTLPTGVGKGTWGPYELIEFVDGATIGLTPEALTVVEAQSEAYTVVLQTRPAADVTVTITGASGDLSLDNGSLVFTPDDWSTPQTVVVTAVDDGDGVQDADVTLTHVATGPADYDGLRVDLVVSIRENDASLVFSETAVTVPEGGTAEYTVALATVPSATVTVAIGGVSGDLSVARQPSSSRPATGRSRRR